MANVEHLQVMSPESLASPSGGPQTIGPGTERPPPTTTSTSTSSRPMSFHAAAIEPPTADMRAFATQHPIPAEDISSQLNFDGRDGTATFPGMTQYATSPGVPLSFSAHVAQVQAAPPGEPLFMEDGTASGSAYGKAPSPGEHAFIPQINMASMAPSGSSSSSGPVLPNVPPVDATSAGPPGSKRILVQSQDSVGALDPTNGTIVVRD